MFRKPDLLSGTELAENLDGKLNSESWCLQDAHDDEYTRDHENFHRAPMTILPYPIIRHMNWRVGIQSLESFDLYNWLLIMSLVFQICLYW